MTESTRQREALGMNVRRIIQVEASQLEAFNRFTRDLGQWWPPVGLPEPAPKAFIEPAVGGRWYERDVFQDEYVWGQVLVWNPPHSLVLSWQIDANGDYDRNLKTEVEVGFGMLSERATLVSLEHRFIEHFGPEAEFQRSILASSIGWMGILEKFAKHCARGVDPAPRNRDLR